MKTKHTCLPAAMRASCLFAAATLSACGGGGGGSPEIPFESRPITVRGTVATSTAANPATTAVAMPVTIDCRNGHGATMSDANGNYTVTTTGLTSGPCVVTATMTTNVTTGNAGTTAVQLRAPARGDGSRANITPLTEALTQYLFTQSRFVFPAGQSSLSSQPATGLTELNRFRDLMASDATLNATIGRVIAVIEASQAAPAVRIPADFLTGELVAKTAANPGNAHSQVLEQLRAKALTPVAGQAAATVVTATGLPSAPLLLRLDADAKNNLLP